MVTDEPGYPCIARRWTGSDDARCVPWPRDAASPIAGRLKLDESKEPKKKAFQLFVPAWTAAA